MRKKDNRNVAVSAFVISAVLIITLVSTDNITTIMLMPIIVINFKWTYLQEYDEAESQMKTKITFRNK